MPQLQIHSDGVLPAALEGIIPGLRSLAEVKILLIALYEATKPGRTGQTLSLTQLQTRAGLSRHAVIRGMRALLKAGLLVRAGQGTRLNIESDMPMEIVTDSVLTAVQQALQRELIETFAIMPNAAEQIVTHYEEDYIRRHIEQTLRAGKKAHNKGGWLITSLRNDWHLAQQQQLSSFYRDAQAQGAIKR